MCTANDRMRTKTDRDTNFAAYLVRRDPVQNTLIKLWLLKRNVLLDMKLECNIRSTCSLLYSILVYYNLLWRKRDVFHVFFINRKYDLCRYSIYNFTKIWYAASKRKRLAPTNSSYDSLVSICTQPVVSEVDFTACAV